MAEEDQAVFDELDRACGSSVELRVEVAARSAPGSSSPAWLVEWADDAPAPILRIQEVLRRNTDRMQEIVREHGWPGQDSVGADGANAAWLLVHHADDLSFQRACLPLLAGAVRVGAAPHTHLEWLADRVLLREGKPERYGTHAGERGDPPIPSSP